MTEPARSGSLDARQRGRTLQALDGASFDLAVIGGGITGAGIARDAAMRGLSVVLFEARDFASGTSSRSSKMIHGGLRYLAQGDIGLVQEAASERKAVERIAPHLARQTPFVIPTRNAGATAKLRAGLWAFEKLGSVPKERRHEVWSKSELQEKEPALDTHDLNGAVVYPEFLTEDARLTLANVRSAAAHGATVVNYAPVRRLLVEGGRVVGLEVADGLEEGAALLAVRAKVVVNAAGPWVDAVRALEEDRAPKRLQLTKGVHLVVPSERLPVSRTIVYAAADKRNIYAVPKGAFTYLGTTDTFHPEESYWPEITAADVDYILDAAARRFSTPRLTEADLVSAWSGVRPLIAQEGKSASDISRKDEVWTGPGGVLSIAGGKLTAFRRMAERIVDMAEEALGRPVTPSRTAEEPLVGGEVDVAAATSGLERTLDSRPEAERLVRLYGSEAESVAAEGAGPAAEARQAVLHEGAQRLEDWWVRRSVRAWFDYKAGLDALEPAAAAMGELLGWSETQRRAEIAACRAIHDQSLSALRPAQAAA